MSNGTRHDRIGVIASLAAGGFLASVRPEWGIALGVSAIASTLYLSPDLDCKGSHRCKAFHRWRRQFGLGWYWRLYAATIPHHRHWLSHSVGVGTVYRLLWLLFPVLGAIAMFGVLLPLRAIDPMLAVWLYVGCELATAVHLWCDRG